MLKKHILFVILTFSVFASFARAQDASGSTPKFGGPGAVENQLEDDSPSWSDWKKNLKDKHGFGFSVDYTSVLLTASETISDDTGAGGIARIYGAWDLTKDGAGAIKMFRRVEEYRT